MLGKEITRAIRVDEGVALDFGIEVAAQIQTGYSSTTI